MDIPVVTYAKEFKTVVEEPFKFDKSVNELLCNGWKLFGVPAAVDGYMGVYLRQTLIKQ